MRIAIFYYLPFSRYVLISMRACTFERTSALSLSDTRSAKPARMDSYRAPRSHTRPHGDDIALFLPVPLASLSVRAVYAPSPALSLLFSFPSSTRPKRRRWRLITTQSPLPVRPGLRPVPRKQQPPFAALGHSPPRYRCCKTNNLRLVPRKKEHCPPRAPFPAPFRQITGGPTDRPTTGIRGIHRENSRDSILAVPIERRGKHALNSRRQLPHRHDTTRNANMVEKKYILG